MIVGLHKLVNNSSENSMVKYANGINNGNLLSYIDSLANILGIDYTSSTTANNSINLTIGSYTTAYNNIKSILNAINRVIYTGEEGVFGSDYNIEFTASTYSSEFARGTTKLYNYYSILSSLNMSFNYSTLKINSLNSSLGTVSSTTIN